MAKKKTATTKTSTKASGFSRAGCGPRAKTASAKKSVTAPAASKEVKSPKAAKTAKKKAASPNAPKPVPAKDAVGFRLRMTPNVHKMLKTKSEKEGVSQNTFINQLIQNAD